MNRVVCGLLYVFLVAGTSAFAAAAEEETVVEKSTGKRFPATVSFAGDYKTHDLRITGLGLRKKFWSKVYGMAHYMEGGRTYRSKKDALTAALGDQHAKQITMVFARDVEADKLQDGFREGFEKNASDSEMAEISAMVDKFVGFFDREIKNGERIVLRVLPGGRVATIIHGVEQGPIESVTFSRVLWRIWLGKHSIVDRSRLVEMVVED